MKYERHKTKRIYVNFSLLKEPMAHGLDFSEMKAALLEANVNQLMLNILTPLSDAYDIVAYSTDLDVNDSYEAETWLVDNEMPIEATSFKPQNYYGKHIDCVLDLLEDDVLCVFETRQSLIEVMRGNGLEVFEYV